jgi:peptidoglycan/LPS O-acetylase OafA/YrhL
MASSPPAPPRFPLLDGLRAIAALSVLVTHTAGLTTFNGENELLGPFTARLNAGVAIFFVLSGFLLYRPWVGARIEGTRQPRLARYARARLLRILPAYWLALTVLSIWPGLLGPFTGDWWIYYGLLQNLSTNTLIGGLGPAWTLSVELSFYALLPLYALGAARWLAPRPARVQLRAEVAVLLGLGVASAVARTLVHLSHPAGTFSFVLPGMFLWFALGMVLAVLSVHASGREPAALPAPLRLAAERPWLSWLGAFAVLAALTRAGLPRAFPYTYTEFGWFIEHWAFAAFAVLMVLPAAFPGDGRGGPRRILAWPPLAWLGLVSYGIYLWHVPLAAKINETGLAGKVPAGGYVVVTAATLAAAAACAAASWYLVERPLLRLKDPPRRPPTRAAAVREPARADLRPAAAARAD